MHPTTIKPIEICAIIITYHPDAAFDERVLAISSQVESLIIVDNASNDDAKKMLSQISKVGNISVIFNNENLGIAAALNLGISHAISKNFRFGILFDQDSSPNYNLTKELNRIYCSHPNNEKVALIGANYKNVLKKTTKELNNLNEWREVKRVITSGSMLSFSAYKKIGPFREDFFIDLVDIEYCIRARKNGYIILKSTSILMSHSIGHPMKHRLFGLTVWTTNHVPIRRYYYARNYVLMQRQYGNYILGWWAIKSLKKCIRQSLVILFFEKNKFENIVAIATGWWHGVNNKTGQYSFKSLNCSKLPNKV